MTPQNKKKRKYHNRVSKMARFLRMLKETDLSDAVNEDTSFVGGDMGIGNWFTTARDASRPGLIRAALHYGYQTVYDALAEEKIDKEKRQKGVELLQFTAATARRYLGGFYTGNSDSNYFRNQIDRSLKKLNEILPLDYDARERFGEENLTPNDIKKFLDGFLSYAIGKSKTSRDLTPQVIAYCASGPFEIALALGAFLEGTPVYPIRVSKSRNDDKAIMLPEHEKLMRRQIGGKNVVVLEDFVETGWSLSKVIEYVERMHPKQVEAFSLGHGPSLQYVAATGLGERFKSFRLR